MKQRSSALMAFCVGGATAVFAAVFLWRVFQQHAFADVMQVTGSPAVIVLFAFQVMVEIGASFYGFSFLFTAIAYLLVKEQPAIDTLPADGPPVGILYLCCDDLDETALESLADLQYGGKRYLIVHDDSRSLAARAAVDLAVARLRRSGGSEVMLLRRPSKTGGKPGALNYILEQTGHLYEFFLLCDNDSVALDPLAIPKALARFQDATVAVVQCRNIAAVDEGDSPLNRLLSRSIDASHVFLTVQAKFGWPLFIGHNAFLRTGAVLECGGFTPGVFADDLDMAVRLNFRGYRVVYAPHIRFAEKHPPSYDAFRNRAYKWSYGCVQILKAHTWRVLTDRRLALPEKISFFAFAGFYVGQSVLLAYLIVHFFLGVFLLPREILDIAANLLVGIGIILVIYAPTLAYFLKERTLRNSLRSVLLCGLVYGTTDFICARAVADCLANRKRTWVPTNAVRGRASMAVPATEMLFGMMLLLTSVVFAPELLFQPCAYLFLGKFLFGPAVALLYNREAQPHAEASHARIVASRVATIGTVLAAAFLLAHAAPAQAAESIVIRGKDIVVDGRPFLVKGIHYGPWRPGTGPGKNYPYPSPAEVEQDLQMIEQLNANTILVFDPPGYVLDIAGRHHLKVLYSFYLNWWIFGTHDDAQLRQSILDRVRQYSAHPALLGWVLGNEVPLTLLDQRGASGIETSLSDLYRSIKRIDGAHPVTSANWPLTKILRLDFFDFAGFNVYPVFPTEVVAMGYGNYIRKVLQPIAGKKPLLITEFGANSLEAGETVQKQLLIRSWEELQSAGTCGGVVFEFADEWWKNYDNPKSSAFFWDRRPAADDEKIHDPDPEEYYGIVDAYRRPKPAYAAVREMFAAAGPPAATRLIPGAVTLLLIFSGLGAWVFAAKRTKSRHAAELASTLPSGKAAGPQ